MIDKFTIKETVCLLFITGTASIVCNLVMSVILYAKIRHVNRALNLISRALTGVLHR